jgi:BioD-like phosphotransacetylase family protein
MKNKANQFLEETLVMLNQINKQLHYLKKKSIMLFQFLYSLLGKFIEITDKYYMYKNKNEMLKFEELIFTIKKNFKDKFNIELNKDLMGLFS